jgi:Gamma-glutamyl cyclotransferase, AIG2-like
LNAAKGASHEAGLPLYGVTFAYGSNLDPDRIHAADRCPHAEEIRHVRLEGWRLEIFAGAADVEPDPAAFVYAVAWRLTPEDEERLDAWQRASAEKPDYVKKPLTATLDDGSPIDGYIYVMTHTRRYSHEHAPSEAYRSTLARAYERHGFIATALDAAVLRAEHR